MARVIQNTQLPSTPGQVLPRAGHNMASVTGYGQTFVCRMATAADQHILTKFYTNIYNRNDCLPQTYLEHLNDPDRFLYVGEIHGKVVAFQMVHVVDDGQTMVMASTRVHPDYQNRGFKNRIGQYGKAQILSKIPTIKRIAWISVNKHEMDKVMEIKSAARFVMAREWFYLHITDNLSEVFEIPEFKAYLNSVHAEQIRVLKPNEAVNALTSDIDLPSILPQGLWSVNYEPLGCFTSNYEKLTKDTLVMVSKHRENGSVTAVSFGTPTVVKKGLRYACEFYSVKGRCGKDVMMAHTARHLLHLHQYYKDGDTIVCLSHPPHIDRQGPQQLFANMGFQRSNADEMRILYFTLDIEAMTIARKSVSKL